MPFDPKLIHPDEAPLRRDGELDLPDDLSSLAEQLGQDAARLAGRYPAEKQPQVALAALLAAPSECVKGRWRRRTKLFVGASLTSFAVIALALTLFALRSGVPDSVQPLAAQPAQAPDLGTATAPAATIPVSFPSGSTALSIGELSGPEREALFDLLRQESDRGSVSF